MNIIEIAEEYDLEPLEFKDLQYKEIEDSDIEIYKIKIETEESNEYDSDMSSEDNYNYITEKDEIYMMQGETSNQIQDQEQEFENYEEIRNSEEGIVETRMQFSQKQYDKIRNKELDLTPNNLRPKGIIQQIGKLIKSKKKEKYACVVLEKKCPIETTQKEY